MKLRIIDFGLFLCIFLLIPGWTIGQDQEFNGVILDDDAYQDTPLFQTPDERSDCSRRSKLSLRPYSPTPGDQALLPSCSGWALANALTIQKAVNAGIKDRTSIDRMSHSVSYVYNQVYERNCYKGAIIKRGLELLVERGDCLASSFSYSEDNCQYLPQSDHHREAARYRIAGFSKLFNLEDKLAEKIDAILCAIALGKPVIVVMAIPSNFRQSPPSSLAKWTAAPNAYHSMVITGYNQLNNTFELMNSYGPDWNDEGFWTNNFFEVARHIKYAYVMKLGDQFGRI